MNSASSLGRGIRVKIGKLDRAPCVFFPKEFSSLLPAGTEVVASLVGPREIRLKVVPSSGKIA